MQFPWAGVLAALRAAPRVFFLPNPNQPNRQSAFARRNCGASCRPRRGPWSVIDEAYFEFSGVTVIPVDSPPQESDRHAHIFQNRRSRRPAPRLHFRPSRAGREHAQGAIALSGERRRARGRGSGHARSRIHRANRARSSPAAGGTRTRPRAPRRALFPQRQEISFSYISARARRKLSRRSTRKGILVRDRSSDFGGEGYVRITLGTPRRCGACYKS